MDVQFFSIAGVVLSLAFSYIPGLNKWFDALDATIKRVIMLVLIAVIAGAYFGLACSSLAADLGILIACDKIGALEVIKAFIACMVANQAAYLVTKG